MAQTVDALKTLYVALGGNAEDRARALSVFISFRT